jgi:hypothetical protein
VAKTLTTAAVEKLKAHGNKRREVHDGASTGLYLIIQASGHKSWALRFRKPDGMPAKLTLGVVDFSGAELQGSPTIGQPLSLPAARQLAAEVHRQRALGRDVIDDVKGEAASRCGRRGGQRQHIRRPGSPVHQGARPDQDEALAANRSPPGTASR